MACEFTGSAAFTEPDCYLAITNEYTNPLPPGSGINCNLTLTATFETPDCELAFDTVYTDPPLPAPASLGSDGINIYWGDDRVVAVYRGNSEVTEQYVGTIPLN